MRFRVRVVHTSEASLVVGARSAEAAESRSRELAAEAGGWTYAVENQEFELVSEVVRVEETDPGTPLTNGGCRHCGGPCDDGEGWNGWCGECADQAETGIGKECSDCHHAHSEGCVDEERCVACGAGLDLFGEDGGVTGVPTDEGAGTAGCVHAEVEMTEEGAYCVSCGAVIAPAGGEEVAR
jgi:hypothetical protein